MFVVVFLVVVFFYLYVNEVVVVLLCIEVSFVVVVYVQLIIGCVYVVVSCDGVKLLIEQIDIIGVLLFGYDVIGFKVGQFVVIDVNDYGVLLVSLCDLFVGDYWMQFFVNVYIEFKCVDGYMLWMYMDQWEGQDWKYLLGNFYGKLVKVYYDLFVIMLIYLVVDQVIVLILFLKDSEYVKCFCIQSKLLMVFWGYLIYLGVIVLLFEGYDQYFNVCYLVVYDQGYFFIDVLFGFENDKLKLCVFWLDSVKKLWVILVMLQYFLFYYDDFYVVNLFNEGLFDDVIYQELYLEIVKCFCIIEQLWVCIFIGGFIGGWIVVVQQLFYLCYYGGSFVMCLDLLDFCYYQVVNIYDDVNVYIVDKGWVKVECVDMCQFDGNVDVMMKDENYYELVVGNYLCLGGQWDIWEVVWGLIGVDGYLQCIWDKCIGVIDYDVVEYWK